ncbi:MAG: hypothetical protein MJY97_11125, partial [Bacteroidales bacterium]|nr:hypothetical protein [Bacteroidales bacterium]
MPNWLVWRIQMIAAAGFVVAASVPLQVDRDAVIVHVWREAVIASAARTPEAGCRPIVMQQMVVSLHGLCHSGRSPISSKSSVPGVPLVSCGTGG